VTRPASPITLALGEVGGSYVVDATNEAAVAQAKKTLYRLKAKGFVISATEEFGDDGSLRYVHYSTNAHEPPERKPMDQPKAKRVAKVRHPALSTLLRVTTIGEAPDDGIVLALTDDSGKTWVARLEVV
jgi:hypothetical protein